MRTELLDHIKAKIAEDNLTAEEKADLGAWLLGDALKQALRDGLDALD